MSKQGENVELINKVQTHFNGWSDCVTDKITDNWTLGLPPKIRKHSRTQKRFANATRAYNFKERRREKSWKFRINYTFTPFLVVVCRMPLRGYYCISGVRRKGLVQYPTYESIFAIFKKDCLSLVSIFHPIARLVSRSTILHHTYLI
jgi:hypothetical protein